MNLGPDFPVHVQQPSGEGVILEVYLESRVKCVLVDWKGTNYKCKLGVQANGQWKGRHLTHAGSRTIPQERVRGSAPAANPLAARGRTYIAWKLSTSRFG